MAEKSSNGNAAVPIEVDILVDGATVVTMDPDRRVLEEGSVAVKDGKILDVGPADELRRKYTARKVINGRRKVVMPGLHDLHAHAGAELIKGVAERFPGKAWRSLMDFVAYHTSEEWWYLESLLSAIQRLKCGSTQCLYMLGTAPRGDAPEIAYANARGAADVGLRSIVGVGPSRPPWPREYAYWRNGRRIERLVTMEETFEATDETIGAWNAKAGERERRIRMWVSVSRILNENPADQVYDPDNEKLIRPQAEGIRRLMDKHDVGFHAHGYGTTAEYLYDAKLPLLGPKTIFGHGWPFNERTVEILAETGTRVTHCPRARRVYYFKGRLPIPELIDAGVLVGLGSDACGMDRPYDAIWEDIFMAPRWQRLALNDGGVVPPGKALEMATIDGAKMVGMDDVTGSLEVGKDADMILIDMWKPHLVPSSMATSRLAHLVRGADVQTVMVRGEILMEDRKVLSVDEDDILEWAQKEAEHTWDVFGLAPLMVPSSRHWGHSVE